MTWPQREALPTMRKLARAFAVVGFPIVDNPARSWWRLGEPGVRRRIRDFQRACTAAGVAQLDDTGELDDATMRALFYLLYKSPRAAMALVNQSKVSQ